MSSTFKERGSASSLPDFFLSKKSEKLQIDRSRRSEGVGSSSLDMFQIFVLFFDFFEQKYFLDRMGGRESGQNGVSRKLH